MDVIVQSPPFKHKYPTVNKDKSAETRVELEAKQEEEESKKYIKFPEETRVKRETLHIPP